MGIFMLFYITYYMSPTQTYTREELQRQMNTSPKQERLHKRISFHKMETKLKHNKMETSKTAKQ